MSIYLTQQQRLFNSKQYLMSSNFLLGSYTNNRKYYTRLVSKMYTSYHNPSIYLLEDQIIYHQEAEFLKRQYQESQFQSKIHLLANFYQYHQDFPRIFQKDIQYIINNHQQDWRAFEYKFVSKKMKQDQSDSMPLSAREKTNRPVEKILKNIELSYYNFQNKESKKQKQTSNSSKAKQTTLSRNKKSHSTLPFYNYQKPAAAHQKMQKDNKVKVLGAKEYNCSQKSKQKQPLKKVSSNSSTQEHKNLSRTKSKSNLVTAFKFQTVQRASAKTKNLCPNGAQNIKNIQLNMQKTQSSKNILQRKKSQAITKVLRAQQKQQGLKSMFKRVVQAKKGIKIQR